MPYPREPKQDGNPIAVCDTLGYVDINKLYLKSANSPGDTKLFSITNQTIVC